MSPFNSPSSPSFRFSIWCRVSCQQLKGEENLSPFKNLVEAENLEIPEALSSCHRCRHSGNRTFCRSPFQPDLSDRIADQPLCHPLGGFPHRPSQPHCLPSLLFLLSLGHPPDPGQQLSHRDPSESRGLLCLPPVCLPLCLHPDRL